MWPPAITAPAAIGRARAMLLLCVLSCALACTPPQPPALPPPSVPIALPQLYQAAVTQEALDPLAADGYLNTIDAAVAQPTDRWALGALHASLHALLWRRQKALDPGPEHALVHRSRKVAVHIAQRLRRAYTALASTTGGSHVWMRMLLANGLYGLALRVGDHKAAQRWGARSGCVRRAALVGPVAPNALTALTRPTPVAPTAAFAAEYRGVGPFAKALVPQLRAADRCRLPVGASSPLAGMHLAVIDIDNPHAQSLYVSISSPAATGVELAGKPLLTRAHALGGNTVTRFARAEAQAGKLRLVVRAARPYGRVPIAVRVLDEAGQPLHADGPLAGDVAAAAASGQPLVVAAPSNVAETTLAIAAALSRGNSRRANALAENPGSPKPGEASVAFDLLRIIALQAAQDVGRDERKLRLEGLAEQLLKRCPQCWEARLVATRAAQQRAGGGSGSYVAWQRLGVQANTVEWPQKLNIMELLWVANEAGRTHQSDVSRTAFDAMRRRAAGSFMVADVDKNMFRRSGQQRVQAACHGGIDRTSVACAQAQLAMGHVLAAQKEMARLRRLRGDPAILRGDELVALLTTGRRAEAMAIYRALSPGERSLALLGAWYQNRPGEGARLRAILRENLATASDAPAALEPLARLLGHVPDLSFGFEQDGAELVAQDRAQAFLPGAGTAVLKRVEWYDLEASGLLHYWLYDLRRVSGTSDVAGGTWYGAPMVDGRGAARLLRRRIYKKDGRVVDPDPRASGRQDQTDLSQLQTGDYVEVVMEGWGLPSEQGQLVVDSADVLPRRTSLRSLDIRFRRPRAVKLALWAHPRLGRGTTHQQGDTITTRWQLHDQPPRTFEEGVPPLEARVAISFGSDSYARIGRAFGDALRGLSEQDPYVTRWVHDATAGAHSARERIDKLVAAVGKTIARSDQYLLSDGAAAWAVGPQRLTARTMLERGEGSRCWVIHRGLQVLGIDSTIAIAESRPFSAAPNFPPRPGRFSHALVRATVDGATLWIDADVDGPPLPPGHISPELRSRKALLASGKILEVSATTQADADVLEVALTLQPNGDARGHFTAQIHGRAAQQLSLALEDEVGPQRTERLRHVVLGWLPWADVKKVKLAASSTSWRIALEADIAVVGLAQPQARGSALYTIVGVRPLHGVYPRGQASSLAGQYARHAARTTPLAINAPQLYRFTRTITLPAGSRLVRTPAAAELTALGISAQRLVTVAGRRLRDTFVFNLPVTTIAAKDYATFAASARAIDDAFLYSYGVELPPQP